MFLILEVFGKPILKYFEWHHLGLRINITAIYVVLLLCALVVLVIRITSYKKIQFRNEILISFLFLFLISFVSIVSSPSILSSDIFRIHEFYLFYFASTVIRPSLYFISGFYLLQNLNKKAFKRLFQILWGFFVLTLLLFTKKEGGILNSTIIALNDHHNYIMMADALALLSIIVFSIQSSLGRKIICFLISLIGLYVLKSRASLYAFCLLGIVMLIRFDKRFSWLALIGCLALLVKFDFFEFVRSVANHRMFRVFIGVDASANMRNDMLRLGIEGIRNNWFFGEYMGDVLQKSKTGNYIHNLLSYWRQFGLIPFTMFILLLLKNYTNLIYAFLNHRLNSKLEFILFFGFYSLLLILFARSFHYSGIWLMFSAIPLYFVLKSESEENIC